MSFSSLFAVLRQFVILTALATGAACQSAGAYDPDERVPSTALPPPTDTRLADAVAAQRRAHPNRSGVYLLSDGLSAFAARATLISLARSSIDVQYYIFAADTSSRLIAGGLVDAADRGVRVRILLDDLGTPIDHPFAATLASHPNIELRLFNPVAGRGGLRRVVQQAIGFGRVNHRMHNKLLVVDGLVLVTGGRNIGDEYFSYAERDFQDLDALAIGEVLPEGAASFDEYWNDSASVPASLVLPVDDGTPTLDELRERVRRLFREQRDSEFVRAIEQSTFARDLTAGDLPLHWGEARLLADPPEKALRHDELSRERYLGRAVHDVMASARERLRIASAYFVPGDAGAEWLAELEARGVEVEILTNSLSTTDVAVVHAGYADYRPRLLRAGVDLWELRLAAGQQPRLDWLGGESRASLHAKAMAIDDRVVFVGSLNLDPRSVIQNTEVGLLVESESVTHDLQRRLESWMDTDSAWRLRLDDGGDVTWHGTVGNEAVTVDREPDVSAWKRFQVWLMSWLPVESQI